MSSVVAPAPGGGAEAMPAGTAAAPAPGVPLWRCGAQTPTPMDVDAVDAPMANASTPAPAPMEVEAPVAFGTVARQGSDASAAHGGAVAEPVNNTLAATQAAPPASPSRAVAEPCTAITVESVEVYNKVEEACPIPETSDEGRRCPPSAPPASPSRGGAEDFCWGTWCKPTGAPWNRVGQGGGGQTN
jgi:hypothetical protein